MNKSQLSKDDMCRAVRYPELKKFIVGMPDNFSKEDTALLCISKDYFDRFAGGVLEIINAAISVIESDEVDISSARHGDICMATFENAYGPLFDENTVSMESYTADKAKFIEMCSMIYRYAEGLLAKLAFLDLKDMIACLIYINQRNHVTSLMLESVGS